MKTETLILTGPGYGLAIAPEDATTAKLGALLADNPKGSGIMVFRDELAGWLAVLDDEMNRGDKAFYLEGYNGTGSFPVDRIGRGASRQGSLRVLDCNPRRFDVGR